MNLVIFSSSFLLKSNPHWILTPCLSSPPFCPGNTVEYSYRKVSQLTIMIKKSSSRLKWSPVLVVASREVRWFQTQGWLRYQLWTHHFLYMLHHPYIKGEGILSTQSQPSTWLCLTHSTHICYISVYQINSWLLLFRGTSKEFASFHPLTSVL